MVIIIECACVVFEVCLIYIFLSYSLEKKANPLWIRFFPWIVFSSIVTIMSFQNNIAFLRIIFSFCGIASLASINYKSSIKKSLFTSSIFCIVTILSDLFTSIIFSSLTINIAEMFTLSTTRIFFLIAEHIVLLIFIMLILLINPSIKANYSISELFSVLPCIGITVLLCYILTKQYLLCGNSIPFSYLFIILGLLYSNILSLHTTFTIHQNMQDKKEYELSLQHYIMQQEYYDQLHIQQESIRALWHDLSKYVRASELDNAESINQLSEQLNNIISLVDSNNKTINIILNEYIQAANAIFAKLELSLQIPDELPVTAADLYIILGNALDNALDACLSVPEDERIISVNISLHNNMLFFEIKNPYSENYTKIHPKEIHGYGLKNIRKCVEKYHGVVQIEQNDNVFALMMHINL